MLLSALSSQAIESEEELKAFWNASGRSFSEVLDHTSTTFFGQYVETVKVRSDNPEAAYQLRIIKDGKEVYNSDKKKGVGEIQYRRDIDQTGDENSE